MSGQAEIHCQVGSQDPVLHWLCILYAIPDVNSANTPLPTVESQTTSGRETARLELTLVHTLLIHLCHQMLLPFIGDSAALIPDTPAEDSHASVTVLSESVWTLLPIIREYICRSNAHSIDPEKSQMTAIKSQFDIHHT